MKVNFKLLTVAFLVTYAVSAQQPTGEGRYHSPTETMRQNQMSLKAYIDYMDEYWVNTPHDFKGSGIKPYLRWRENVKYTTKPNGAQMTREEIRASWKEINEQRNARFLNGSSAWIPIGPFDFTNAGSWSAGQGRVNITAVDPSNPNVLYIGTPDGGAWKSIDHGTNWTSITDDLPIWGVSGIAVDPNNSNTIYIATGDEDGWDSYSDSVYKSTDGGINWQPTVGINPSAQLGEIYINPSNPNMLWVCSSQGFYRSTNAGLNWTLMRSGNVKEMRLKPNNPNTIYAVNNSGTNAEIWRSNDMGQTFSIIKTYSNAARTVIDVTDANPEVLYVLVSNFDDTFKTLDKSSDGGASFNVQHNSTDLYDESRQSYYDLALAVSNSNENEIYMGCLNIWKSTNGGVTFYPYNSWYSPDDSRYTHADIHDLKFYNGNFYAATDGGVYTSTNNGNSMQNITKGVNNGQFYRIDVAQNNLSQVVGGLQDNGGYVHTNNTWKVYYGADGMDCAINPINPNEHFGFIQFGQNLYKFNPAVSNQGSYVTSNPNEIYGEWITPLEMGNQGTLYAGYDRLYKLSLNNEWQLASTQNFPNNLEGIRVAPDNDKKVLVYDGASLYQSDGTQSMNFNIIVSGSVHCFDYNRNNSNLIYYANFNGVYKSTDGGETWTNISQGLPNGSFKVGIIHQAESVNNTIYLATNNAVYYINDNMQEWELFSDGLPHSRIRDIEVNNVENSVLIATFGRGVWRSPVDPESLAITETSPNGVSLFFYPNPTQSTIKLNMSLEEESKVEIFNLQGKLVKSFPKRRVTQNTEFNISELPKGIYIVRLTSPSHLISKKIVKE